MFTRILLLFLFWSFAAFAQSEGRIETDRPDQTECPFIVKKGYLQGRNRLSIALPREYLISYFLIKIRSQ